MAGNFSFGYWLKRQRKARDLTQVQLAQQVGVAVVTLRKIEADVRRPSLQLARRLAEIFELDAQERETLLAVARGALAADQLGITAKPVDPATYAPLAPAAPRPGATATFRTSHAGRAQATVPGISPGVPPQTGMRRDNLPAPPNQLIGRDGDVAAVCALLRRSDVRMVTLTGPAGAGKTRLALQVASQLLPDFAHGV